MRRALGRFMEPLRTQAGRDTVRAFALFGILLAGIVAVSIEVVYRDMERVTKVQRVLIGRHEAGRIADFVGEIGREPGGLDYGRVRRTLPAIEAEVRRMLSESDLMGNVAMDVSREIAEAGCRASGDLPAQSCRDAGIQR